MYHSIQYICNKFLSALTKQVTPPWLIHHSQHPKGLPRISQRPGVKWSDRPSTYLPNHLPRAIRVKPSVSSKYYIPWFAGFFVHHQQLGHFSMCCRCCIKKFQKGLKACFTRHSDGKFRWCKSTYVQQWTAMYRSSLLYAQPAHLEWQLQWTLNGDWNEKKSSRLSSKTAKTLKLSCKGCRDLAPNAYGIKKFHSQKISPFRCSSAADIPSSPPSA